MDNKEYIKSCLTKLNNTSNNLVTDNCTKEDIIMINLLKGIIVVEKESATGTTLYNQLKGNYFQSDLSTADFVNKLYIYDIDTLKTYLDIYLEQTFENGVTTIEIESKINEMRALIEQINVELLTVFNEKLKKYNNEFKL